MRELALILPGDVWLTNLTGTASSGVSVEGAATVSLRDSVAGPALAMSRLRDRPESGRGIRSGAEGDRWSDTRRRAVLKPGQRRRRRLVGQRQRCLRHLPNKKLHRPVPAGRRLRRGAGSPDGGRRRSGGAPDYRTRSRTHERNERRMSSSNRLIVSILAVAAIAIAFWMLALGPKREQADELSGQVSQLQTSLATSAGESHRSRCRQAGIPHRLPAAGGPRQGGASK